MEGGEGVGGGEVVVEGVEEGLGEGGGSFVGECVGVVSLGGDGEVWGENGVWIEWEGERLVEVDGERVLVLGVVGEREEGGRGRDGGVV